MRVRQLRRYVAVPVAVAFVAASLSAASTSTSGPTSSDVAGPLRLVPGGDVLGPDVRIHESVAVPNTNPSTHNGVSFSAAPMPTTIDSSQVVGVSSSGEIEKAAPFKLPNYPANTEGTPTKTTQWCYYYYNGWLDDTQDDFDDVWGLSKVYREGKSYNLSYASHGGESPSDAKAVAWTQNKWSVTLTGTWPQGARMVGVVNPKFKGMSFLDSNRSVWGGLSGAYSQQLIRSGWENNGLTGWHDWFKIEHEAEYAVDDMYTDSYPGAKDGLYAYVNAVGGGSKYAFKFRSDSTATVQTDLLAPARSQMDWGSTFWYGKAPTLGRDNYVRQDGVVDWVLIGWEMPDGYSMNC